MSKGYYDNVDYLEKGVEATVRYSDYDDLFENECKIVQEPLIEE